jgi:hypothetical protein
MSPDMCFFMHTGGEVFYERVPTRKTKRKNREETLNKIATRRNFQKEKNPKQKGCTIAEREAANDRHQEAVLS